MFDDHKHIMGGLSFRFMGYEGVGMESNEGMCLEGLEVTKGLKVTKGLGMDGMGEDIMGLGRAGFGHQGVIGLNC